VKGFVSTVSTARLYDQRALAARSRTGYCDSVNDPEGYGRVQVKLPTYNEVETDWMGVVTPGLPVSVRDCWHYRMLMTRCWSCSCMGDPAQV